nr:LysR family transcriptional regulator [Bacillota bacterium]
MLLEQLITFCTVVDEGGFTRAAEVLGLSQPAVTKQVKSLEKELRAVLLTRSGRRVNLTPAGEIVYSYARRIIHTIEECQGALANLTTPGYGRLTIGAVSTVAIFTLPEVLSAFVKQQPLVTVHVRTGTIDQVLTMVLRNEMDLGIVTVPISHE